MDSGQNAKPFLTVRETAKLLGVHENTVRNWVKDGRLISARLPGATTHRFAREEVQRLLTRRGDAVSSIAPILRVNSELVTAAELAAWAGTEGAKGTFPELMRRLLSLTPGISNLEVRAHEGVAAAGWDGTATSVGSAYLPAGELRFEFGTDGKPKKKAQEEYDKRAKLLPRDAGSVFVFATPRNWANAKGWAVERAADNKFLDVKAIDAHVLEGWLQATPSVHYWISERLGYRPRDAQTIERWWDNFRGRMTLSLPAAFFAAGRQAEAEELRGSLAGATQSNGIITIRASWHDDALAFLYAALDGQGDLLGRTIIVTDEGVWQRLADSTVPLVLVPMFDGEPDLASAIDNGHRVVVLAGPDDVVRHGKRIGLGKLDRMAAQEALKDVVGDPGQAGALVALGRRSVAGLVRHLGRTPLFRAPDWVQDEERCRVLTPLVLAGSWTDGAGDLDAIERLTGSSADLIESLLRTLAGRPDAPFVRSGGGWRLASPVEAALLLLPRLTVSDLKRWRDVLESVLLAPDPLEGLDDAARLVANAGGAISAYSETLKQGLADGLALAAASADELPVELQMQSQVDSLVHGLLESANADPTGAVWARLAPALPSLAEAAPEVLQDAIEFDLDCESPVLRTMFRDQGEGTVFGSSSPHPNLIWALETLCLSPSYFGRAALLLGRLSSLDPGGRLSNRPIHSLQSVTTGWIQQSGAGVDDKMAVIGRVLKRDPDVGWKLVMGVWPTSHGVSFPLHAPTYRDWSLASKSVTFADWGRFIEELVALAMTAAGETPVRWQELIPKLADLPPRERHIVMERLREVAHSQAWTEEDRYSIWSALTIEADRHEDYAQADWAMSSADVALLRSIAEGIAPSEDPRRFSSLFGWRARVSNLNRGDVGYDEALVRLQNEAIDHVLAQGAEAVQSLVRDVEVPDTVGRLLAQKPTAPDQEILAWLDSDDLNLRTVALTFANRKIDEWGIKWLQSALASPALQDPRLRRASMAAVPFAKAYWTEISTMGPDLEAAYWQGVQPYRVSPEDRVQAVRLLLQHDRPWDALVLLGDAVHDDQHLELGLAKDVIRGLTKAAVPTYDATMRSYFLTTVLEYMELRAPDDEELPGFEFLFFEFLHEHRPSSALYRALNSNPAEFVNLVSAVFRAEGEGRRNLTVQEQARARISWHILQEWPTLPGMAEDGSVNADELNAWVRAARLELSENRRSEIGDELVGQILSKSPFGHDGFWPAEPVRELVESIGNARIEAGLHIGKVNQRGVTSRGVFDGGDQERRLEAEYREMAAGIAAKWPRTARVLRGIADGYRSESRRRDADAERFGDEG
jgi:excisionase family DNA binding protein